MKETILKQYDETASLFQSLGNKLKDIIIELLDDNRIAAHNVNFRLKEKGSLSKKIDVKPEKYRSINDITDICGIRIITFLESDVDRVAKILEKELNIDKINSIDKRLLKTDQFGYRSLHYVIELDSGRLMLSENKKFTGFKVEVQIRSILQHAWAEIEHDLGYKGEINIPENLKRNFNRLAALLETADVEFDRLKGEINKYEENIAIKIQEKPSEVKLDQASILSFVQSNQVFSNAREIVHKNIGCEFIERKDVSGELERFPLFQIKNIEELENSVSKNEGHFIRFVNAFSKKQRHHEYLSITLPLFYFQHFLAASKESKEFMNTYYYYAEPVIGDDEEEFGEDDLITIFKSTKN